MFQSIQHDLHSNISLQTTATSCSGATTSDVVSQPLALCYWFNLHCTSLVQCAPIEMYRSTLNTYNYTGLRRHTRHPFQKARCCYCRMIHWLTMWTTNNNHQWYETQPVGGETFHEVIRRLHERRFVALNFNGEQSRLPGTWCLKQNNYSDMTKTFTVYTNIYKDIQRQLASLTIKLTSDS